MKIGDRIYVRGYIDEIRKDTVIVRNDGGYFGTILSEVTPSAQPEIIYCKDCKHYHRDNSGLYYCGRKDYGYGWGLNDFCSDAERRTDEQHN